MDIEVLYYVSNDGTKIWFDNAEHNLRYSCEDFDVFLSSNARQTAYVVVEWPVNCDMVFKIKNAHFQDMTDYELSRYVRSTIPNYLEQFHVR